MSAQKNKNDLGKQRSFFLSVGLVLGLSFLLVAFEWRSFKEAIKEVANQVVALGPIEEIAPVVLTPPPPTSAPPPPPPPPSAPEVIEIADNNVEIDTEMNIDVSDMNVSEGVEGGVVGGTGDVVVDEVVDFLAVEDFPVYPGCEGIKNNDDLLQCFNEQVTKFLQKNVKYPGRAKEMNKEGIVYVKFTIGKDGAVKDVGLALPDRKIGYGLEEEAMRVVGGLPKMQPAKQRNIPTAVSYQLPIQFRLQ